MGLYNSSFLLVVQVTDRIPIPQYLPVVLYLSFGGETGPVLRCRRFRFYWVHRLMHTRLIWPVHRWHHSPTSLYYWLAGFSATIPHIVVQSDLYCGTALLHEASGVFQVIMVAHIVRNNWMHLNVTWNSAWLERVFVTPRYHHIHHSSDPAHQMKTWARC